MNTTKAAALGDENVWIEIECKNPNGKTGAEESDESAGPHFLNFDLSRRVQIIRLSSLFLTDTNSMLRIVDFNVILSWGVKKKG